jgi:tetratricopeptide (TPR) repeat protein
MNTRFPFRYIPSLPRRSFSNGFLGCLFLIVSTVSVTYADEPLDRTKTMLSLIKTDLLRYYQSGKFVTNHAPLPPSGPAAGNSVPTRNESQSPGPARAEADLQTIAELMKRLDREADSAAVPSKGGDRLAIDEMRLLLCDYFLQENMTAEAEKTLKDLAFETRRDSIAAGVWFRLEKLYYRQGRYQEALGAFYKIPAKVNPPMRQEAAYLAGNGYLYLKDYLKAVEVLNKIGDGSEFYPFALYSSGLAYLNLGDAWSSTQQHFQKIVALSAGEDPVLQELINKTHVTLGFFFIDQKRYPEAMAALKAVPTTSRYWIQARLGIGKTYIGVEDCVKAIVVFRELIERSPVDPYALEARLHIGSCYSRLSAYRRAVDSYQDALKAYADRSEYLKKLVQKIKKADLETGLFKTGTGKSGVEAQPTSLAQELAVERDFPEFMEVYNDWSRLNNEIADEALKVKDGRRPKTDAVRAPDLRSLQTRLLDARREWTASLRSAALDHLSNQMAEIDDLALRANVGIAKNMTFMQDHETGP